MRGTLVTSRTISVVPLNELRRTDGKFKIQHIVEQKLCIFTKVVGHKTHVLGSNLDHTLHEQSYMHFQLFAYTPKPPGLKKRSKNLNLLFVFSHLINKCQKCGTIEMSTRVPLRSEAPVRLIPKRRFAQNYFEHTEKEIHPKR